MNPSSTFHSVLRTTMSQFQRSLQKYTLFTRPDREEDFDIEMPGPNFTNKKRSSWWDIPSTIILCVLCLALGFIAALYVESHYLIPHGQFTPSLRSTLCKDPPTRREWRTLSHLQKEEYVKAVQCLSATESNLGLNQTLHGDFPLVHSRVGNYCTGALVLTRPDLVANFWLIASS